MAAEKTLSEPVTPEWMGTVGFELVRDGRRPKDGLSPDQIGGYNSREWEQAPYLIARGPVIEIARWCDRDEWWLIGRFTPMSDQIENMLPAPPTREDVLALLRLLVNVPQPVVAKRRRR